MSDMGRPQSITLLTAVWVLEWCQRSHRPLFNIHTKPTFIWGNPVNTLAPGLLPKGCGSCRRSLGSIRECKSVGHGPLSAHGILRSHRHPLAGQR